MVFELAHDFSAAVASMPEYHPRRRILALIEESLRRDIHFIDRHPTTLFQCLWNTGWWYDCGEASGHFDRAEPEVADQSAIAPARESTLHRLLEKWRRGREASPGGQSWIRTLRPFMFALGTGQLAVMRGHSKGIESIALSADKKLLATGSTDNTMRIWDVASCVEQLKIDGHDNTVMCVAFRGEGKECVSAAFERETDRCDGARTESGWKIRVWDAQSGRLLKGLHLPHTINWRVAFSSDGNHFAANYANESVRVWCVDTGQQLHCFQALNVESLAFSADQQWLVTEGKSGVAVWSLADGTRCLSIPAPQDVKLRGIAISADGSRIACGSEGAPGTIWVWDGQTGQELHRLAGHEGHVVSLAFSPDARRLVSGSADCTIGIWNLETGNHDARLFGNWGWVDAVAFSKDASRIYSGAGDWTARIWDASVKGRAERLTNHRGYLKSVAISRDGALVATGATDQTVRLWDTSTGLQRHCLDGHRNEVVQVAFSPDSKSVFSLDSTSAIKKWDAETGECLNTWWPTDGIDDSQYKQTSDAYPWYGQAATSTLTLSGTRGPLVCSLPDVKDVVCDEQGRVWAASTINGPHVYIVVLEEP